MAQVPLFNDAAEHGGGLSLASSFSREKLAFSSSRVVQFDSKKLANTISIIRSIATARGYLRDPGQARK